ncbi:MAG: TlyA family rRNA (cytidine-2'-O)-methyltransferase [Actinobacteria bacterium HGW-Actinobacteria-9]|jgi:23S rRNA (cytidine1920-2'-O)/16S rRNA (cytidine1409-2'-O)-methyltransferase|nr:MAG: TlyA family rRNA (cytidine-2'-O)-methyltransferase [Actinobacteria bacterium HGW-Actinobacteria-9]
MSRRRIDVILAERGLFESRERARAAILAGEVRVGGQVITKAGEQVAEDVEVQVAEMQRYVSRGGTKLAGALDALSLDVTGARAVDVGASTGGFTDCLLQRGAESVSAVDVGYGQLAWQLRQDPRVRVFERTNIRSVDPVAIGAPFDLAVVDVSFIGVLKVLPNVLELLGPEGEMMVLVKPQFEIGKGRVGKKGVVRDPAAHVEVLESVMSGMRTSGLSVKGATWSPITGPEGNIEFWIRADRSGEDEVVDVAGLVAAAHESLGT